MHAPCSLFNNVRAQESPSNAQFLHCCVKCNRVLTSAVVQHTRSCRAQYVGCLLQERVYSLQCEAPTFMPWHTWSYDHASSSQPVVAVIVAYACISFQPQPGVWHTKHVRMSWSGATRTAYTLPDLLVKAVQVPQGDVIYPSVLVIAGHKHKVCCNLQCTSHAPARCDTYSFIHAFPLHSDALCDTWHRSISRCS